MYAWLADRARGAEVGDVARRMDELVSSIRRQCIELIYLAGVAGSDDA